MCVVATESERAELETEAFEFFECCGAGVDVRLLFEAVVPALGHKHHRDPVVARVATDMFKAPANYFYHVGLHSLKAPLKRRRTAMNNHLRILNFKTIASVSSAGLR